MKTLSIRHSNYQIDLSAVQQQFPERYPCLLESIAHGTTQSRYDILFAFPGQHLELDHDNTLSLAGEVLENSDFLDAFDDCWRQEKDVNTESFESLPFRGGWFVYLAYEMADQIEPTLKLTPPKQQCQLPKALAIRFPAAIIRDHLEQKTILLAEQGNEDLLNQIESDVTAPQKSKSNINTAALDVKEEPDLDFLDAIKIIKQYILEGDVFQVNLSRQWHVDLPASTETNSISASKLYQRLCLNNPAPFGGLFLYKDSAVISSSPERLVSLNSSGKIESRPIAGTRPRSTDKADDNDLSRTLMRHPKEKAEHIMLIDLQRNDLGRICQAGSIHVDELMVLESYAHVHHIVSNLCGQLRDNVTPGEVIRAVFPGGTITGCPKVHCMEIIAELEQVARGPYTGSMGFINHDGSMDLNILIRTLHKEDEKISFRAGAGIVADSIAEKELEETRSKARGLLLALEVAALTHEEKKEIRQ